MGNNVSPYSGGDTPELTKGLNADTVDGCHVSTDVALSTSNNLIPTSGAAKSYIDTLIAGHSLVHNDIFYTKTETDYATDNADLLMKNYLINGAMEIVQRGTSFVSPGNGLLTLDRWLYYTSGTADATITQDTDVPETGGFQHSLKIDVTTVETPLAVNGLYGISQTIEGYFFKPLVGKDATLSFWVKGSKAGTHCVAFFSGMLDSTYIAEYTITDANTWEFKEINLTFDYSVGTWDYTNGAGLCILFVLASGTDFHGTAEEWTSTPTAHLATENQVNEVDSTANNFFITGVMLNEGEQTSSFRLAGGSFAGELELCRRYYETSYPVNVAPGSAYSADDEYNMKRAYGDSRFYHSAIQFAVSKRSEIYTITFYTPGGEQGKIRRVGVASIVFVSKIWCSTNQETQMFGEEDLVNGALYSFMWVCECEI